MDQNRTEPLTDEQMAMIDSFQCPGCMVGCGPPSTCDRYEADIEYGFKCKSHISGTFFPGAGKVHLGLPKGFNRAGAYAPTPCPHGECLNPVRLWIMPEKPEWNRFNLPTWAMARDGFLLVRTYLPRRNYNFVDVVKAGTLADLPTMQIPMDVGEFFDEID